ncbi:hypothetical protein [Georgenia sp.]
MIFSLLVANDSGHLADALIDSADELPAMTGKSLTWDQGTQMACWNHWCPTSGSPPSGGLSGVFRCTVAVPDLWKRDEDHRCRSVGARNRPLWADVGLGGAWSPSEKRADAAVRAQTDGPETLTT